MLQIIISVTNDNNIYSRKILDKISDKTLFEFLIYRLKMNNDLSVHILTSSFSYDDIFEVVAKKYRVAIFRHEDYSKVSCILEYSKIFQESYFIRIPPNYPLVDIKRLRKLTKQHIIGGYEYSYNDYNGGVIWGTGIDIYSKCFLHELNISNNNELNIDELSYFLQQNEKYYRINKASECLNAFEYKLACENSKDVILISKLINRLDDIKNINNEELLVILKEMKIDFCNTLSNSVKENGVDKLLLHTQKIDSIVLSDSVDISYPVSVELTLTNRCNLRCIYCSDYKLRQKQGFLQDIDINIIKKLFDDLASGGTKGIVLEGGGEPTLYYNFTKIVKYAKQVGLAVGLITNGTIRLSKDILKVFEWIRVSLDASTDEEYENIKGIDFYENVIKNISYYSKYCKAVGVGYVVTINNCSKIEALIRRLRNMGVAYIQLRPVVDSPDLYPYNIDLNYLQKYQVNKFGVNIDGMKDNAIGGNNHLPCRSNGLTSVISGDGSVYLCGRLNIYDWVKPIGNINYQSFQDIWSSQERKKQWEMVQNRDFCEKICPQCRMSKFNKLIYQIGEIKTKNFI